MGAPPAPLLRSIFPKPGPSHGPEAPGRYEIVFDEARVDPDVQKVLRRLVRHNHEAYLVGGCVRDLLLDRRPKDFDVATSARPEEVRELFRNSRIIGRRFRLVHVLFQGGKVIEVATFRRNPKEETDEPSLPGGDELLIRSDNVFGEASDDALRRDFTINALFYDIEKRQILDWVGGMEDVRRRVVHTIGDPETRFREDPVRILRALKFAGRLDLGITPDVYDAIVYCRESWRSPRGPASRRRSSASSAAARRGAPSTWPGRRACSTCSSPSSRAALRRRRGGRRRPPGVAPPRPHRHAHPRGGPARRHRAWTLLLLEPMKEASDGARDRAAAVADFLEPLIERLAISRRYADGMRRIVSVLPRLVSGKAGRFARTEMFQLAVEVAAAELRSAASPPTWSTASAPRPPGPVPTRRATAARAVTEGRAASDSPTKAAGGGASRRSMAGPASPRRLPSTAARRGDRPLALGPWDREPSAQARERRGGAARGVFEYGARVQAPQKFLERRSFLHGGQLDTRKHGIALRWLVERYGHADDDATALERPGRARPGEDRPVHGDAHLDPRPDRPRARLRREAHPQDLHRPLAATRRRRSAAFAPANTYRGIEVSNHLFGIAIDINPDRNPCCGCVDPWPSNPLCKKPGTVYKRTALPRCWIKSFERFGFDWLGHDTLEDTMHFEFLGDPEQITR